MARLLRGTIAGALNASTTGGGLMAVGSVSESSGTPTGHIIEEGSNSNGIYTKYADGTMICRIQAIDSSSSTTIDWTYPIAFADQPTPAGSSEDYEDRIITSGTTDAISTTTWSFHAHVPNASGHIERSSSKHNLMAIGRWFT